MVRDLGDACTAWDVYHSEEIQWLMHACSRNRARIIAKVCKAMQIPCACMLDYHDAEQKELMAIVCTETIHHDLKSSSGHLASDAIQVFNYCSCTGYSANGILCCMAPWEGIWVFHGTKAHHEKEDSQCFGKPYGSLFMPTFAPQIPAVDLVHRRHRHHHGSQPFSGNFCTSVPRLEVLRLWGQEGEAEGSSSCTNKDLLESLALSLGHGHSGGGKPNADFRLMMELLPSMALMDNACPLGEAGEDTEVMVAYRRSIAKLSSSPSAQQQQQEHLAPQTSRISQGLKHFLLFDEPMLQTMCKKGWNRALGYTPLITMACGMCEDWHHHRALREAEKHGRQEHERDLLS